MKLISVIIPTYNRKELLKKAIDSIFMQTYNHFEIIVINDCSDYDVAKEFDSPKIKVINNKTHQNAGISRKNGFSLAKGDYIIFMDDDDYYVDNEFFEKSIETFRNLDNLSFVCGQADFEYVYNGVIKKNKMNIQGRISGIKYLENFQTTCDKPLSTFTTVFSKDKLIKSNFHEMNCVNDSVIFLRSLSVGDAYVLSDTVGHYCIHNNNLTNKTPQEFMLDVFCEKYALKQAIKATDIDFDIWWQNQYMITMKYYIYGTKPSILKLISLYNQTKEKHFTNYKIFFSVFKSYIYMKIKRDKR